VNDYPSKKGGKTGSKETPERVKAGICEPEEKRWGGISGKEKKKGKKG